jgi:membrane-bound lytic murein transglycosylase B/archaellum component FlaC
MKRTLNAFFVLLLVFWLAGEAAAWAQAAASAATSTATSTTTSAATSTAPLTDVQAQQQDLENQLAQLEQQIEDQQQQIDAYHKQGNTLSTQIKTLNAQITQLNLQIKAVNLKLQELNGNIADTQTQINQTQSQIDQSKAAIAEALQTIYESDNQGMVEILLANNTLSDFFGQVNDITLVQNNLRVALDAIVKLRGQLITQQQALASEKTDTENFQAIQQAQKQGVVATQNQKATLLKQTQGQEAQYKKLLAQTQATAAQIRQRIFQLLGGGQMTFGQAYSYAKLASQATGVRPALILAILDRESALGQNVGKCSYKTAMNPTRDTPIFLKLLAELGMDPNSQATYVSCANSDGAYGGAMGPAQFIPSTWALYSSRISQVTGDNPANPWNNSDAFVATGIYIADLEKSASCVSYSQQIPSDSQELLERCAAAKYYAGGSWYTYRFWDGQPVVNQANAFESDIQTLIAAGN